MPTLFHLSPVENRDSILRHGLDPRRMGAAPGLANSERRELDGVYVCPTRADVDWFVETMGPSHPAGLDLWAIEVADDEVLQTGTGNFEYLPVPVPPERVELAETFTPPYADRFADLPNALDGENGATIEWEDDDDGIVVLIGDGPHRETADAAAEPGAPRPLPGWLAPIADGVLRDITDATAAQNDLVLRYVVDAQDATYASIQLHDAAGAWEGQLGFSRELSAPQVAVELATALQRWWIERPHVAGTLHPPCPDHRHAAVAAEHDDAAWWTCPADGRRLARIGTLR